MKTNQFIALLVLILLTTIFLSLTLYFFDIFKIIPPDYSLYIYAAIWFVGALLIFYLISYFIHGKLTPIVGKTNAATLSLLVRLLGYIIAVTGFLALIKVGLGTALAVGGFAGLVIGLAAQTVLSNVIAGLMLIISRPYKIGDRVTVSTWQYGMVFPIYPPKYYSHNYLIPGYTGRVKDVSLLYTIIQTDELVELKIPNSIMIQASIEIHTKDEIRKIRTRYDVPKDLDIEVLIKRIKEDFKGWNLIVSEPEVYILESYQNIFSLAIDVVAKTFYEEPIRSEVIKKVNKILKEIKT
jgi:Small-conductance mechanosensitive channel